MTDKKPSYLAAAFNARPFGMPIPPNWFALAAFGLLGALVNPGLWFIGAGVEGLYLWALSRSARFRRTVDAEQLESTGWGDRYRLLQAQLDKQSLATQSALETQASEIVALLGRVGASESQTADVRRMVWLHLKLLAARAALDQVVDTANRERHSLENEERDLQQRLEQTNDAELRRTLERHLDLIRSRRDAHTDAQRRRELVDAELARLRQQIALVREQALLATDEQSVAQSLDSLSASLNEANRWLKDQRELFAGLDNLSDEPPPELLNAPAQAARSRRKGELE